MCTFMRFCTSIDIQHENSEQPETKKTATGHHLLSAIKGPQQTKHQTASGDVTEAVWRIHQSPRTDAGSGRSFRFQQLNFPIELRPLCSPSIRATTKWDAMAIKTLLKPVVPPIRGVTYFFLRQSLGSARLCGT